MAIFFIFILSLKLCYIVLFVFLYVFKFLSLIINPFVNLEMSKWYYKKFTLPTLP